MTRAPISPAHVLLIEDDELERQRVADLLQAAGYRVSVASSGQDGLNNLREGRFDAVVLVDAPEPLRSPASGRGDRRNETLHRI